MTRSARWSRGVLAGRVPPEVTIIERAGDMIGLLEDWTGRDAVVLIDAAAPITTPGSIHRIDLLREPLPIGLSLASTHAFGVADAVALARALGQLPERLIVYAVEGCRFEPGAPQSPEVVAAAEEVAARVVSGSTRAQLADWARNCLGSGFVTTGFSGRVTDASRLRRCAVR